MPKGDFHFTGTSLLSAWATGYWEFAFSVITGSPDTSTWIRNKEIYFSVLSNTCIVILPWNSPAISYLSERRWDITGKLLTARTRKSRTSIDKDKMLESIVIPWQAWWFFPHSETPVVMYTNEKQNHQMNCSHISWIKDSSIPVSRQTYVSFSIFANKHVCFVLPK